MADIAEPKLLEARRQLERSPPASQKRPLRLEPTALLFSRERPCAGHVPCRSPYVRQVVLIDSHAGTLVGNGDGLGGNRRGPCPPKRLEPGPKTSTIHVHTIEKLTVLEHRGAAQSELVVESAPGCRRTEA